MKVKARNLIELILQALVAILLFVPGFYRERYWDYEPIWQSDIGHYLNGVNVKSTKIYSFWNGLWVQNRPYDNSDRVLGLILCVAIICGIVLFIIQFMARSEKRNWLPTVVAAGIQGILFACCSIGMSCDAGVPKDFGYLNELNLIFYIMLVAYILLLVITVLGYIKAKKHGIIEDAPATPKIEVIKESSGADELKKYKELLDDGIITQEEFDAKKKQLLGI